MRVGTLEFGAADAMVACMLETAPSASPRSSACTGRLAAHNTGLSRRRVWLPLGVAALLSACSSTPVMQPAPPVITLPPPPTTPSRQPEVAAFRAVLNGHSAVPRTDSPAQGELVAVLNRKTGLLQWKLSFSGLSGPVRLGSFHSPGMSDEVAAPVVSLGRSVLSPSEGRAMLTPKQRSDLLAGQWYVNLTTARYPEGEVRGQLIEQR
ncbi:CHRD domain-containing protein [Ottowia sp. GY511]|nr:CHRD domain-containing protein [Ottowia sp. GY511]